MNKLFLYCAALFSMQMAHGMQEVAMKQASDTKYRVVTGDIFLMHCMYYRGYGDHFAALKNIVDAEGNPITIAPQEPVAEVWATDKPTGDFTTVDTRWSAGSGRVFGDILGASEGYTFPEFLPLSLLDGKNDGDTVTLYVKNPVTQEIFKVELMCKQLAHRYKNFGDFQAALTILKRSFVATPRYADGDKEKLIEAGILVDGRCKHGPNGFKFHDETSEHTHTSEIENGRCVIN